VFAAAVHSLEQEDDRVRGVGVEQMLQLADAFAKLSRLVARLVLLEPTAIIGIEIAQANSVGNFDWLRHGRIIRNSTTSAMCQMSNLRSHDEVVFRQAIDLVGPDRDSHAAPREMNVRM